MALAIEQGRLSARRAVDLLEMKLEDLIELSESHGVKVSFEL